MATEVERLLVSLEARVKTYERQLARAQGQTNKAMATIERRTQQMAGRMEKETGGIFLRLSQDAQRAQSQGLRPLLLGATALGGALSVNAVRKYADEWTSGANRLRAAGVAAGDLATRQEELYQLAQDARAGLGDTIDLYARLRKATVDLGVSEQDLQDLTATVTKSLIASGASASEAQGAMLQLGQALGSGKLQGDELRSLTENSRELAQAIADEFGVPIGQLQALGAAGKLTADRVVAALLRIKDQVAATFAATQTTTGQAITKLENAFIRYIGKLDESVGATRAFAGGLDFLTRHMDEVATAIFGLTAALGAAGLVGAATRAAAAIRVLTLAMAANPVLLIATAVSGLIALLIGLAGESTRTTESQRQMQQALDQVKQSIEGLEKPTKDRLAMLRAQAREALAAAKAELELARTAREASLAKLRASEAESGAAPIGSLAGAPGVEHTKLRAESVEARARIREAEAAVAMLEGRLAEVDGMIRRAGSTIELPAVPAAGGGGKGKTGKGRSFGDDLADAAQRSQDLLDQAAAALQGEQALARLRHEQELYAAAARSGAEITPELAAQIRELATSMAAAEAIYGATNDKLAAAKQLIEDNRTAEESLALELERQAQLQPFLAAQIREEAAARGEVIGAVEAQTRAQEELAKAQQRTREEADETGQRASDAMESIARSTAYAIRNAESFGDVLQAIGDRLADIALDEAFDAIFRGGGKTGGGGAGGGGLFAQLADWVGGLDFSSLAFFAGGGRPTPGQPAVVGEKGPEVFVPDRPGTIISNDQLRQATAAAAQAPVGMTLHSSFSPTLQITASGGADPELIRQVTREEMTRARRGWARDLDRNFGQLQTRHRALRG